MWVPNPGALTVSGLLAQLPVLVAGVMLWRGSLAAVAVVRWLAAFSIPLLLSLFLIGPLSAPVGLVLTYARIHPDEAALAVVRYLLSLLPSIWLFRQLGSTPVEEARAAAGRKRHEMWVPLALGTVVPVLSVIVFAFTRFAGSNETAVRAESLAARQLGPGYRYHMTEIKLIRGSTGGGGAAVEAVVTAWYAREIRKVPVQWELP